MRYLVLVFLSFLVSCATPQSDPRSFYGETYAPGKVVIEGGGAFISTATVKSTEFMVEARKAAYLRLMEQASSGGYQSVEISKEDDANLIGYKISIHGTLFLNARTGKNIFPVASLSRVLNGLSLENEKARPIVKRTRSIEPKARHKTVVQTVAKRPVVNAPVVKPIVVDLPQPTVSSAPSVEIVPEGAPTVIMAPEDITGSIKKVSAVKLPVVNSMKIKRMGEPVTDAISIPKALAGTPLGIVIRSN